jgi:uncharacterized protein
MHTKAQSTFATPSRVAFSLAGEIQRRIDGLIDQWILPAPLSNPAILEMFRDRNRQPYRILLAYAGEFAGKYLTHCVQIYQLARSQKLREHIDRFVDELISLQADNGYLGPWSDDSQLTGKASNSYGGTTWDAWGHYHVMLGLLLWHEETHHAGALTCAKRIADLFCNKFLGTGVRLHSNGWHEMNLAPIHSLGLLYRITGDSKYLAMMREIEKDFETPPAGDYIRTAIDGKEFYQTPKPRWESLHPILGIAELYYATGDEKYRRAFEHIWWSIVKLDRHNTGGFSSGEQAFGDPYRDGVIESCCTIAWMAMSVEMLKLSGCSIVADEIELSLINSGLGMMNPSGRWVTYNTPMDGTRIASCYAFVFQARGGLAEVNCCAVNGPRAIGFVSDIALMRHNDALVLNYYGPGSITTTMHSGQSVTFTQETDYPRTNTTCVSLTLDTPTAFALKLRIPYWSKCTTVVVNDVPVDNVTAGTYLTIDRIWSPNDRITVTFDFILHVWIDETKQPSTDYDTTWQVFGPIANTPSQPDTPGRGLETLPTDTVASMPTSLTIDGQTLTPHTVTSTHGCVNFSSLFGTSDGAPIAVAYTEITCDSDCSLHLVFGADWWATWFVNGVKVFDTHTSGNGGLASIERRHPVTLQLRRGKNLIAVRVTSGSAGWLLSVGQIDACSTTARSPHVAAVYRGPVLLAYDRRFNETHDSAQPLPTLAADRLAATPVESTSWIKPWMLFEFTGDDGEPITLCDYASAGVTGNYTYSWLPMIFAKTPTAVFDKTNPLRSFRP